MVGIVPQSFTVVFAAWGGSAYQAVSILLCGCLVPQVLPCQSNAILLRVIPLPFANSKT